MSKVTFTIESTNIPLTVVTPTFKGGFDFEREKGKARVKHKIKDPLIFKLSDYETLIDVITNNRCEEISVSVRWSCGNNTVEYWAGVFAYDDCTINRTLKKIEVKPQEDSAHRCVEKAIKVEQNLFFNSGANITVQTIGGTYETQQCTNLIPHGGDLQTYYDRIDNPESSCLTNASDWCLLSNKVYIDGNYYGNRYPYPYPDNEGDWFIEQFTIWHRETVTTNCDNGQPVEPIYGSGWSIVTNDCSGTGTVLWSRCPPFFQGELIGPFTRGRLLKDVIIALVNGFGCGLTVKSDFLNINPLGDAPSNIAYSYALANLQNVTFHQISDIKLKNGPSFSTEPSWEVKPEDLLSDIFYIFNLDYDIEGNTYILEHVSFFASTVGLDKSNDPIEIEITPEKLSTKIVRYDYKEEITGSTFNAKPIVYNCGDGEKETRTKLIHADIGFIQNPENGNELDNKGFVLIANQLVDNDYIIINSNSPLRWENLHANLHRDNALFPSGTLNGVETTFLSYQPLDKQKPFKHVYRCAETFNPKQLIRTSHGDGILASATHNIYTCNMEINLNY